MDITGKKYPGKTFLSTSNYEYGRENGKPGKKMSSLAPQGFSTLPAGIEYCPLTQAQKVKPRRPLYAVFTVCSSDTVDLRCCQSFEVGLAF